MFGGNSECQINRIYIDLCHQYGISVVLAQMCPVKLPQQQEVRRDSYSGTPPYDHPVYKTTSLLRPYSFKPNIKNIHSFYYFEDPVNATTSLLRPGFYGPTVVALTGFHCIFISRESVSVHY